MYSSPQQLSPGFPDGRILGLSGQLCLSLFVRYTFLTLNLYEVFSNTTFNKASLSNSCTHVSVIKQPKPVLEFLYWKLACIFVSKVYSVPDCIPRHVLDVYLKLLAEITRDAEKDWRGHFIKMTCSLSFKNC